MWKKRTELPVMQRLEEYNFDQILLEEAYKQYTENKTWDGLGNEYASMCETYTRLPKMFFKQEELENVDCVCDIDWEQASYQQISLVDFDESFSLDQRTEHSGTRWDNTVAKNNPRADERFFRKRHSDLPEYFHHVLDTIGRDIVHRTRFAKLAAHSSIKPHIDYNTEYGVRLHIPITTNSGCSFGGIDHDGKTVEDHMPADGGVWYINPGVKHWARNNGETERVHMIISVDSQKWF